MEEKNMTSVNEMNAYERGKKEERERCIKVVTSFIRLKKPGVPKTASSNRRIGIRNALTKEIASSL